MTENQTLIYIPKDGNYIEILGYRIDGFDSFEDFCKQLKKYAELEKDIDDQLERVKADAVKEFAEEAEKNLLALRKTYRHFQEKCVVDACRLELREMVEKEIENAE